MSDKKIGVLGGSGEIGKRCVNILTEKGYTVMASYRTQKPMENNENVYVQLDICNENELCMFMANCDVVINCAGASFINGEKIARTAAKMKIPLVDPSGESFLEERIKDIQKDNVFVLSSGCFPGMTGVLLNFLCSQFDDVKSLSGMSISTEIPSQSAIEDFILTNIAGFGQPLKYYNNGEYVRDEQIFYEIVRNSEFKLQNYYTVELERVVKKYRPELDCIYGISLGASIAIEIALRDCIRINKLILDGGQFESMGIMKKIDAYFMAKEFQKVIQKKRMWSYVSKQMGYRNGNEIEVLYPLCCKRIQFDTLYDAALAAYGYDIKKRMEKLRMKVVIMYGGNELFAAKSVSLVKEKCVSECEVYAYDNMGHSEVLSLHPEKLCEIIRK